MCQQTGHHDFADKHKIARRASMSARSALNCKVACNFSSCTGLHVTEAKPYGGLNSRSLTQASTSLASTLFDVLQGHPESFSSPLYRYIFIRETLRPQLISLTFSTLNNDFNCHSVYQFLTERFNFV